VSSSSIASLRERARRKKRLAREATGRGGGAHGDGV